MSDNYSDNYDDIIDLPHHVSMTHPRMSSDMRAAQFSPFAALTGYEECLEEAVRQTSYRVVLHYKNLPACQRNILRYLPLCRCLFLQASSHIRALRARNP